MEEKWVVYLLNSSKPPSVAKEQTAEEPRPRRMRQLSMMEEPPWSEKAFVAAASPKVEQIQLLVEPGPIPRSSVHPGLLLTARVTAYSRGGNKS